MCMCATNKKPTRTKVNVLQAALAGAALANLLSLTTTNSVVKLEKERSTFMIPHAAANNRLRPVRQLKIKNLSLARIKSNGQKIMKFKLLKRYKTCLCEPLKKDCSHFPPKIEITRQKTLEKIKSGRYKTYLDSIAEKDRKFCKTSTTEKSKTKKGMMCTTTTTSSTTPLVCGYPSTVFMGVIACPVNNDKIGYFLWVKPNRRKLSVKAKCHRGKHVDVLKQVPVLKND